MKQTVFKSGIFVAIAITLLGCSTPKNSRVPASSSDVPFSSSNVKENFSDNAWAVVSPSQMHRYKDLYFMSDIHGQIIAFANLLYQAGLVDSAKIDSDGNAVGKWTGKAALLVLDGDYIDGGDSSAQVLAWIEALQKEAKTDLIPLLGNHEAEFLAEPQFKSLAKETRASFGDDTDMTATIKFLHTLQLGAVVGSWFIAHSGYIVPASGSIKDWLHGMATAWSQEETGFKELSDSSGKGPAGVLERHNWWDKNHDDEQKALSSIGLNGFIGGHEPDLFGSDKTKILISNDKWAAKIDTGLKDEKKDSTDIGEMLHCSVADIDDGNGAFKTLDHCKRLKPDGSEKPLKN